MKEKMWYCYSHYCLLAALAQNGSPINKDFAKKTKGIANSFKLNDSVGVFQITLTDTTFELVAVDDKLQVLWYTLLKGHGLGSGKFNGNILAISSNRYSNSKGTASPYNASLIDEHTGRLLIEKQIPEEATKHLEVATTFFADDGSKCTLIVRHANTRSGFLSEFQDETEYLDIITFNEKLEPKFNKPIIPDGIFVSMACNFNGDFFILTCKNNGVLTAWRYGHGDVMPAKITQECAFIGKIDILRASNSIVSSEKDKNVLYFALTHDNSSNDQELTVGKFDFKSSRAQVINEVFTGKHVRNIEENSMPVKNIEKPEIGSAKDQLKVKYLKEHNDKLIVALSEQYFVRLNTTVTYFDKAMIINCYDGTLKQLFQQVMPVYYVSGGAVTTGFDITDNTLRITANNSNHNTTTHHTDMSALYGNLDLSTGRWLNLQQTPDNDGNIADQHVLWFKNIFVVPYLAGSGLFSGKINIELQSDFY